MAMYLGRLMCRSDQGPNCRITVSPFRRGNRHVALILMVAELLSISGCSVWSRIPTTTLPEPAPEQVQVWRHDSAALIQKPAARGDTLIGFIASTRHDTVSTQVRQPLAELDSLRVKKVSASRTALATIALVASVFFVFLISGGFYSSGH